MKLGIKKMHIDAQIPKYGHENDACMDLYVVEDYYLRPGDVKILNTGVSFDIPAGYSLEVRPRSSAIKNQLIILNAPGTIDESYTGIVYIGVKNVGDKDYDINKGDRMAQIKLEPVIKIELYEIDELKQTDRGAGGFGSTGR